MENTIIWLDGKTAKLYHKSDSGVSQQQLHPRQAEHHTHSDKNHLKDDHGHFFKTIYENIKEKNKILILGPSLEKKHFRNYLETHFPASLTKILAIETVDHPTENQIVSYFEKFDPK